MSNFLYSQAAANQIRHVEAEVAAEHIISGLGVRYRYQYPFPKHKAIVDFLLPDFSLVVEIDDPGHNRKAQREKDALRQAKLEAAGFTVMRFTNAQVLGTPDSVFDALAAYIDQQTELRSLGC